MQDLQQREPQAFDILMEQETSFEQIKDYKELLTKHPKEAGTKLQRILQDVNIEKLTLEEFIERLLETKKPGIRVEKKLNHAQTPWNEAEIRILGNIGFAMPVEAGDDCAHENNHESPLPCHLLFIPGALLAPESKYSPDRVEVRLEKDQGKKNEPLKVDKAAYYTLNERRLLPLLFHANNSAHMKGKEAFITMPALGTSFSAGKFKKGLDAEFQTVLRDILNKHGHNLPYIKGIYLTPSPDTTLKKETIHRTTLITGPPPKKKLGNIPMGNRKSPLSEPKNFNDEDKGIRFNDCERYSFVNLHQLSWPGNDWMGGSRPKDDGGMGAATDTAYIMTGIRGRHTEINGLRGYHPPMLPPTYLGSNPTWGAIIKKLGIKLSTKNKVKVVGKDGTEYRLQRNELIPLGGLSIDLNTGRDVDDVDQGYGDSRDEKDRAIASKTNQQLILS